MLQCEESCGRGGENNERETRIGQLREMRALGAELPLLREAEGECRCREDGRKQTVRECVLAGARSGVEEVRLWDCEGTRQFRGDAKVAEVFGGETKRCTERKPGRLGPRLAFPRTACG